MTVQEIITQALHIMNRSTDGQALIKYSPEVIFSLNEGVKIIAQRYRQSRSDTIELSNGTFAKSQLSRRVYQIKDVKANGIPVTFAETFSGSGVYRVNTTATTVDVIYRFVPAELSNSIDEPELPEEYHGMLVNYAVGNKQISTDPALQSLAAAQINLFNSKLSSITPCDVPTVLTGYFT